MTLRPLEHALEERYAAWFRGHRARLLRPLLRGWGRWSRLDQAQAFLQAHAGLRGMALVDAAREWLQLDYRVDPAAAAHIPAHGRVLVVANHPSGARDALALLHWIGSLRRDVRIVANDLLAGIEPLRELLLPVRVLGGATGAAGVRAVEQALREECCVIVFPAGEVSRLGPRGIADTRWRRGFLRFARSTGAPVVPVRVKARNSALFYGASMLFKPAGTVLLPREAWAGPKRPLRLYAGAALTLGPEENDAAALRRIRAAVYALGRERGRASARIAEVAPPWPRDALRVAVQQLPCLGRTADGHAIHAGRVPVDGPLMHEIGRLRELTFRAVGEGTGQALDIDAFDGWYDHIVLWDARAGRLAGAYRVARGAQVLAQRGLAGLYTATLFDYGEVALPRIAQGLELGRSFVAQAYWGSRGIDYLWQGVGAYLARHPQVRYLFGAVSMSAATPLPAREQIVAFYRHFYGHEGAASARQPFPRVDAPAAFERLQADTAFALLQANLRALGAIVPMLYKQYTQLCDPGGVRFLAFGVDPAFADSVDGLIELDLHCVRPKKRQRYLAAPDVVPA